MAEATAVHPKQSSREDVNPPITKITDQLYLGNSKSSRDRDILCEHGIQAVVSFGDGPWTTWRDDWYKKIIREGNHMFHYCEDTMTMDMLPLLREVCDFIKMHVELGHHVLVHCDRGRSRSVTALISYLVRDCHYDLDTALAFVGEKRKIRPNKNFREQLAVWEAVKGDIWASPDVPKPEYAAFLATRTIRLKEAGLTGEEPIGIRSL